MNYEIFTLVKIIIINVILSGDNAIVIAMACRKLKGKTRRWGILLGTSGAIIFRVILTFLAALILKVPFLQFFCGLLLFWIGVKLLTNKEENSSIQGSSSLSEAVKIIIAADFIMSIDNILGVAAAAKGNLLLLSAGLLISIPLIVFGSKLIIILIEKQPSLLYVGASIIAYIAGDIIVNDPFFLPFIKYLEPMGFLVPILFIPAVILTSNVIRDKSREESTE